MKKILLGLLMIAPVAVLMHAGCNNPKSPILTVSGNDTLFTTIVRHVTTKYPKSLYRLISQKAANVFDTIYSDTVPPTTIPLTFGSTGNCGQIIPQSLPILYSISFDTIYRIVDDPASRDTIFVFDSLEILQAIYRDTINCRIDTIEAYRKSHKPYFDSKDSIKAYLNNATEGLRQYILLPAFHFDNDSATIKLIDNPSWAQLEWISVLEGYGDCWFYPTCVNGVLVSMACLHWIAKRAAVSNNNHDCFKPYLVFAADSTALDSTYRWKVVIANKYAQSDTISVSSTVKPFPYSCP